MARRARKQKRPLKRLEGGQGAIPTSDPRAALEFCRRLADAMGGWRGAGGVRTRRNVPLVSVVIPLYDEEENLPELHQRLSATLSKQRFRYELLFVNDGSRDSTRKILERLAAEDVHVIFLDLARNFGHQVAISAGLEHSTGRAVIVMDGDLQDPPEVLPEFIAKWREGYEVVYAVRSQRKEWWLKRMAYSTFYRMLQRIAHIDIPLDAGDFCIMDRCVVDHLVSMPERNQFLRGIRSWLGFRQTGLTYERHARYAGKPKYTFRKLVYLALDGMLSFSYMPLRVIAVMGIGVSLFSIGLAVFYVLKKILFTLNPPGFATLAVAIFFLAGIQLVTIGVMGEYVARISDEVKQRPLYIMRRLVKGKSSSRS